MNGVSHGTRWPDGLLRRRVAEPDRAVVETRDNKTAITAKRRAGGPRRGGQQTGEEGAGRGVAELDGAVTSDSEERTTVGTECAGQLVSHRLSDRLPSSHIPETRGGPLVVSEQRSTIAPEFNPGDAPGAGQQFTNRLACSGIPKFNACLARMIVGKSRREDRAVRAVGQAHHDIALGKRTADLPACRGIPEPNQSVEIARGEHLTARLECQRPDIVGVRHWRKPQPACARVPDSQLASWIERVASGREASAVGTECDRTDLPARIVRGGPSHGAARRGIRKSNQSATPWTHGRRDGDSPIRPQTGPKQSKFTQRAVG